MLKTKSDLVNHIYDICRINTDMDSLEREISTLYNKYNIPKVVAYDAVTFKRDLYRCETSFLFMLLSVLDEKSLPQYFSDSEIKIYGNMRLEDDAVISLPLAFNVIQIDENQWIGRITCRELMQLRKAHFIRYNENTQRALTRKTRNGKEQWSITINRSAVKEIKQSFETKAYIPNILTFNITEEGKIKYRDSALFIDDISYLDILDGYHRYLALCQLADNDQDFDYTMELRLVHFTQEKARQFIWQEDQKTKMKKIVSNSYNQASLGTQCVNVLNQSEPFMNKINNNDGVIKAAIMTSAIDKFFFNEKRKYERKDVILVKKELISRANKMEDLSPDLFDSKWDERFVLAFVAGDSPDRINQLYDWMLQNPLFKDNVTDKNISYLYGKIKMGEV